MLKEISKIELTFENCELFEIDSKFIGEFLIENIEDKIARVACNYIGKYKMASTVVLEISKLADTIYDSCGENSKFNRIKRWDDITGVRVYYKNNKKFDDFAVNYNEGGKYGGLSAPNINQKVTISKLGNLYLVIDKDKDINDYFDIDEINSKEHMDFKFGMYDITGDEI